MLFRQSLSQQSMLNFSQGQPDIFKEDRVSQDHNQKMSKVSLILDISGTL